MEYTQIRDVFLNNLTEYERRNMIVLTNYLLQIDNDNHTFLSHRYSSSIFNLSQYDPQKKDTIIHFANYIAEEYKEYNKFYLIRRAILSTERIHTDILEQHPRVKKFLDIVIIMNLIQQKLRETIKKQNYVELQTHLDNHLIKPKDINEPCITWHNVLYNWLEYNKLQSSLHSLIYGVLINQSYELHNLNMLIDGYANYDNLTALVLKMSTEQFDNIYDTWKSF